MRLTYDPEADAAFLYLVDEIRPGEVKRSQWVPLRMKGASMTVSLGEDGRALGVEFLGASKQLAPLLLEAAGAHETAQSNDGGDGSGG